MARRWRFLLFPSSPGMFEVPPLSTRVFVPATGERRELRCGASFVNALTAHVPEAPHAESATQAPSQPRQWPWIAAALFIAALLFVPRLRRERALRNEARAIVRDATPAEIRARMQERVKIAINEPSERGDAWRALLSLLDAAERERDIAVGAEKEIERRVLEVLRT